MTAGLSAVFCLHSFTGSSQQPYKVHCFPTRVTEGISPGRGGRLPKGNAGEERGTPHGLRLRQSTVPLCHREAHSSREKKSRRNNIPGCLKLGSLKAHPWMRIRGPPIHEGSAPRRNVQGVGERQLEVRFWLSLRWFPLTPPDSLKPKPTLNLPQLQAWELDPSATGPGLLEGWGI